MNREQMRLAEAGNGAPWRKWGPYLSERQWGTVREDYSENGDAWGYFPHDHARSRAYRSGEDGLAGFCDDKARLCFALALWNGQDPILKERLFGLTNPEGNHGEDVKEYYFYLDATPTHSYMKYLYKYPQRTFPYLDLVETNRRRSRLELEYELIDTGVFADNRYFDVFVEYAKASTEDILIRITVENRGPDEAMLHVLPTLWFRNTWSRAGGAKPALRRAKAQDGRGAVAALHPELGERWLYLEGDAPLLFTENETNSQRLFGTPNPGLYVKDGIGDFIIHGRDKAVNPDGIGTKAAAHYPLEMEAEGTAVLKLRLTREAPGGFTDPFHGFDQLFAERRDEADEFYRHISPSTATEDEARVFRQAMAGMLWSKQYYVFEAAEWIKEHGGDYLSGTERGPTRNREWSHMVNDDVISMPDKWEYPWYAAWDLAFHAVALASVDIDFAKSQLDLMLRQRYLHPNGQIPAYEWNFSDVNPPVHAWATVAVHETEMAARGRSDLAFLKRSFSKLLANFTWWVNRKDRFGKNVFEGGFLGLDNISVFDRSAPLPTGGYLEQADGTSWMAFFSQNMLELAMSIAEDDPTYEDTAAKFLDHVLWISHAINHVGMWDEEDGFFYDVLRLPDGRATRLKVRSMVGLLPICATSIIEPSQRERVPGVLKLFEERTRRMPQLVKGFYEGRGHAARGIMALVNPVRLRRILACMLDESEFLSPYGIRALSRYHLKHPYLVRVAGKEFSVKYLPADSDSGMFGGNSNWRGPVWMPVNMLIIRALLSFYLFYGDSFKVECPTGSG
ncbi:MAG: glucosidase, partial [Acidobacteria bacterium]